MTRRELVEEAVAVAVAAAYWGGRGGLPAREVLWTVRAVLVEYGVLGPDQGAILERILGSAEEAASARES